MKENKTPKSQLDSMKAYRKRNPEKTKIAGYKSSARTYVRHYATRKDLEDLIEIFNTENKNGEG